MVPHKRRGELDVMIIKIVESCPCLGYKQIEYKVNLRCEGLGLKKPSTKTFWLHITELRDVLDRKRDRYGGTHYSLKKEFKDLMDKKKIDFPINCVEKTLEEFRTQYQSDEKPIEIIEPSEEESSEDKKTCHSRKPFFI